MRRVLLSLALAISLVTAIAGALLVPLRVPLLGRAAELGRGPLAWRIETVVPGTPAATAGLQPGEVVELQTPYARYRYRQPGDAIAFMRAGAPLVLVAGPGVAPNATPWRLFLRAVRLLTHLAMCALAAIVLWRRFDDGAARALAWFLLAFGFSLSFDAGWFPREWGAVANVALDLVIAAMLVAATRFAATIGDVDAPVRAVIGNVSVVVGGLMAASVSALLALQYLRGWNEPLLLTGWWTGWAVQLGLTLCALGIGFARALGTERRRLSYVVITFAVGFSGPIVATFGLALTGSAAGTPMYETLVAWRLTSIAIPIGFGYAVLFHHLLDIEFVFSRAMIYGVITSGLVPLFAIARFTVDKVAGKNFAAGSVITTLITVLLLAYFEPMQKAARKLLDNTVFRARTKALKGLKQAADDIEVLGDQATVVARVVAAAEKHAGASGATVYIADDRALLAIASDLAAAPFRLDLDAEEVARLRRTREPLQPAGGAFGPAALALPMLVRGKLTGIVALGVKDDGQHYAPDEIEALQTLAGAAASALDALSVASRDKELSALRAVRDELARVVDPTRAASRF